MGDPRRRRLRLETGETVVVDVLAAGVEVDGEGPFQVSRIEPGVYQVARATARWIVYVASRDGRCWVSCNGDTHAVELADSRPAAAGGRRMPRVDRQDGQLSAPMPATVTRVLVTPGQAVEAGDLLLVLEAMKMELPVRAPRAGLIRSILCRDGELVQPGVPLLEME